MARVFITGSTEGLGLATADTLLRDGHEVIVHARSPQRIPAVQHLLDRGAQCIVGDLAAQAEVRQIAADANRIGRLDAVIHNAGVLSGAALLPVNVVAPYLLTALIPGPRRLIYLSSGMHRGGDTGLDGLDWAGRTTTASYSTTKLHVTALSAAVARLAPDIASNAVDPGWVPTRMGGRSAPDSLELGHRTQEWLATSDDPAALSSGGYWYHQHRQAPHPAANDPQFQDRLLARLAEHTGVTLEGR
ncbi:MULTISPECIES: SDR family NAD(P)-dependent oxidoreductase [unclassified Pseudarthrobacter]|uniref:SDR family NAD(P)-dependent oxidoreductase n=1 Tax=unclassified Pseudarthrobacter TaxID=2647000 RepID=UPI001130AC57|nr:MULTISPECIES: SDR family NAD(P)-dependent oxidoreductase [unclassified Pseudarthrobacter]QDG61660.1 SDR family NAD(P)-dependent oxidoreductase [Pseudarthrobacter sp. NIBRBAC000502771]QDG90274.1 SDR family NAD(P)-dependent oxidoreductase [Pseudarthrobacter sp. NIBRBAC000502770]